MSRVSVLPEGAGAPSSCYVESMYDVDLEAHKKKSNKTYGLNQLETSDLHLDSLALGADPPRRRLSRDSSPAHSLPQLPSETASDTARASGSLYREEQIHDPYLITDNERNVERNEKPNSLARFVCRFWIWECLSVFLSVGCMAAIVAVAIQFNGKPLNDWSIHDSELGRSISPTAVVSFLGVLGRSACLVVLAGVISQLKWLHFNKRSRPLYDMELFDEASRGPWGSLRLLVLKNKTTMLASCASVITLASLVMDPFVQLIFDFPSEFRNVTTESSEVLIETNCIYDYPQLIIGNCLDPQVQQAATISSMWNNPLRPSTSCYFQRCDWPPFTTLGVCRECADWTNEARSECDERFFRGRHGTCNYTSDLHSANVGADFDEAGLHTEWNSVARKREVPLREVPLLLSFDFIKLARELAVDFEKGAPPLEQAMQCNLTLCSRAFPAHSSYNRAIDPNSNFYARPHENIPLVVKELFSDSDGYYTSYQLTPSAGNNISEVEKYTVGACAANHVSRYLESLFEIHYLGGDGFEELDIGNKGTAKELSISLQSDMPSMLQNVADSLTEAFRTRQMNGTSLPGVGLASVTVIRIKWVWLCLPLGVVSLSLGMLTMIIVKTRSGGVPLWKSASLAVLFHDVETWDEPDRIALYGPEEIERLAKRINAQTTGGNGTPTFLRMPSTEIKARRRWFR